MSTTDTTLKNHVSLLIRTTIEAVRDSMVARKEECPDFAAISHDADTRQEFWSRTLDSLELSGIAVEAGVEELRPGQIFVETLTLDRLLVSKKEGNPFDRDLLAKHFPDVRPTQGLSWDDLDHLSAVSPLEGYATAHDWIHFEGRFFDPEAPEGVTNFFELPYFQREIEAWIADGKPTAEQSLSRPI